MKTSLFTKCAFGAALLLLPLLASCNPQTSDTPTSTPNAQTGPSHSPAVLASAAPAVETSAAPDPTPPPATPPSDPGPVPAGPDPAATNELPPYIFPTSPVAQVARLMQAGVDPSIILTYVTNSSGTFNLDSDKIIYLRDIGLPGEIITAMIQRDQVLQQQMTATTYQPPAQPTEPAPPTDTNTEPVPAPPADQPAPPPTEVTVNNFYDTLAPYGSWVYVTGYGRCWRPSVVAYNPNWQPYCDHGRWVYTDCGWYWCSDYSWGWAPFHYGRWFQHPHMGWCWTPDTVWGPSWVTWRYANGCCGWAPLPPSATYQAGLGFFYRGTSVSLGFNWGLNQNCFTFVPTQYFCDPQPRRHSMEPVQVARIFSQTAVINNFEGQGHNLANRGIDPERISTVTRTPLRPVAIRNISSPPKPGQPGEQLSHDGSTLLVNRPTQPWSSGQNHSRPSVDNQSGYLTRPTQPTQPAQFPQPIRPTQVSVVTTHGPQDGNGAIRIPPQRPSAPANYNSSPSAPINTTTAPNQDSRTYSPRGWEQSHPSQSPWPNTYPSVTRTPGQQQLNAPAAIPSQQAVVVPAPQPSQPSRPVSTPVPSSSVVPSAPVSTPASTPRSSNQNQNQGGTGYSSGSGYNSGSSYGPRR